MKKIKKWKRQVQIVLALVLLVGTVLAGQADVHAASKKVALNVTNISLSAGQTRQLKVSNAKKVKWSTSKKSVVSVSWNGKIKAKKAGRATITAKFSGKKLSCSVVVSNKSSKDKKILIAYFSQTGKTENVAQKLQKLTGGDLLRIKEKDKYTSDYDKLTKIAKRELNKNARPKVTTEARNIKSYDVVYVGYPIWWGEAPHIVYNLVENVSLRGKTVVPFCTSISSGLGKSAKNLKKNAVISGKTKWLKGRNFYDVPSQKTVNKWVKSLKLKAELKAIEIVRQLVRDRDDGGKTDSILNDISMF